MLKLHYFLTDAKVYFRIVGAFKCVPLLFYFAWSFLTQECNCTGAATKANFQKLRKHKQFALINNMWIFVRQPAQVASRKPRSLPAGYGSPGGTAPGYSYHPGEKIDKGMALKDLFELALTALAFKTFGLFILNVIMCIWGGVRISCDSCSHFKLPASEASLVRTTSPQNHLLYIVKRHMYSITHL